MAKNRTVPRQSERLKAKAQAKANAGQQGQPAPQGQQQARKKRGGPTKKAKQAKQAKQRSAPEEDEEEKEEEDAEEKEEEARETETAAAADEEQRTRLLDAYTRSLLPCSYFGLADELWARGVWSLEQESALRDELEASPQYKRFVQQQAAFYAQQKNDGHLEAELQLADILQHRFRCHVEDLFRYGLRPGVRGAGSHGGSDGSHGGPAPAKYYLLKLACILTHPIWNGIAAVRWLLQRVVQERVPGHVRPLVPAYSYWQRPFVATAREWASGEKDGDGKESDGDGDGDAKEKAAVAEAELGWFLFAAGMPRDLWRLDRLLTHDEPGDVSSGAESEESQSEESQSEESQSAESESAESESIASTDSTDSRLSVCSAIKKGRFGLLDGSFADCEITQRQERLRRQDALLGRPPTTASTTNPADLTDEQVFFDLQEQDLDRMLALLADEGFMYRSGSMTPECYYAGYKKAHDLLGYGDGSGESGELDPLLTCHTCSKEYHQVEHLNPKTPDGHVHFLHQQFVRGDPTQMLAWLQQRKCEWLAAGVREARINAALRAASSGGGSSNTLPDVPPFDPVPMGHLDRVFTDPSQLEAMERASRGDRPHASVLWCMGGPWEV